MINDISFQIYRTGLQARDIYPELKKYFYKENSDVTWKEFLTTKFALWIDTRSSIENTLHGSGRTVEKSGILLQIEKAPEASGGDLTCHVFSTEFAMTRLNVTDPSGILTIEKPCSPPLEWICIWRCVSFITPKSHKVLLLYHSLIQFL